MTNIDRLNSINDDHLHSAIKYHLHKSGASPALRLEILDDVKFLIAQANKNLTLQAENARLQELTEQYTRKFEKGSAEDE